MTHGRIWSLPQIIWEYSPYIFFLYNIYCYYYYIKDRVDIECFKLIFFYTIPRIAGNDNDSIYGMWVLVRKLLKSSVQTSHIPKLLRAKISVFENSTHFSIRPTADNPTTPRRPDKHFFSQQIAGNLWFVVPSAATTAADYTVTSIAPAWSAVSWPNRCLPRQDTVDYHSRKVYRS